MWNVSISLFTIPRLWRWKGRVTDSPRSSRSGWMSCANWELMWKCVTWSPLEPEGLLWSESTGNNWPSRLLPDTTWLTNWVWVSLWLGWSILISLIARWRPSLHSNITYSHRFFLRLVLHSGIWLIPGCVGHFLRRVGTPISKCDYAAMVTSLSLTALNWTPTATRAAPFPPVALSETAERAAGKRKMHRRWIWHHLEEACLHIVRTAGAFLFLRWHCILEIWGCQATRKKPYILLSANEPFGDSTSLLLRVIIITTRQWICRCDTTWQERRIHDQSMYINMHTYIHVYISWNV